MRLNLSGIDLHNFIIVMLYFFEVYGAKCRLDIKFSGKFNLSSLIYSHNYFCGYIHLLIQTYTKYLFCT